MAVKNVTWAEVREEMLQDPEFRKEWEATRWIDELIDLRLTRGLSQRELARRAGTSQAAIARLENGRQEPSLRTLRRVVEALGGRLEVCIRPAEAEAAPEAVAEPPATSCCDTGEAAEIEEAPEAAVERRARRRAA